MEDTAMAVVKAFQALRDGATPDQWDVLCACERMDALLTALGALEDAVPPERPRRPQSIVTDCDTGTPDPPAS